MRRTEHIRVWRKPAPGPTPVTLEKRAVDRDVPGWQLQFPIFFSVSQFPMVVEKEGSSVKMALGSSRRSGSRRSWQHCQLKLTEMLTYQSPWNPQLSSHHNFPMGGEALSSGTPSSHLLHTSICFSFLSSWTHVSDSVSLYFQRRFQSQKFLST